ncbi:MAG TPA: transporter substrate-binding domain-containing protein [Noviherbaspirillum sp.]|uniref:substrate-binding periplasmic protein n=1 Tax=Noviherbaspirillum sp. TaxID=1926288 RepID=UPI002D66C5FF|nr:transporter substrate-binding domain-containing protein [Noviherbaspirillum sp.]HYD96358.1 transporter substrate-binding domain-containing protein [Noviherbaspirillum sp.]
MDFPDFRVRTRGLAAALVRLMLAGIAALVAGLPAAAQSVDDLTFITEDYPPFNFERDGKRQGIAVDLLADMLANAGAKKTRADIKVWPWARGYETALREKNVVLFSTTRTAEREHLFKWVGPIMPSRIVLVARKQSGIRLKSVDDINNSPYKVGVVREDIGGQLLARLGLSRDRTVQANSGVSLAKMLHAGRVDLWAYGAEVIMWNMKELGHPASDYEEVLTLTESQQYYFAVNKDTDDRLVAKLQAALDQVKAKGRVNDIVARYR